MTSQNIKKVVIPFSELPGADSTNFFYNVRYRLVSEDKNRTSHWSRVYNIQASVDVDGNPLMPTLDYHYTKENAFDSLGGTVKQINLNWIIPVQYEQFREFDIFVKRYTGTWSDYSYLSTIKGHNYTIPEIAGETKIKVLVQTPVYPKEISASSKLFETVEIVL